MLYKVVGIWLAIQLPLGLVFGLMLRSSKQAVWAEQDAEPNVEIARASAGTVVEQGAG